MLTIATLAARFGPRTAVVEPTSGETLSYDALATRVQEVSDQFGEARKLVLVEATNDVPTLVAYLAALQGGHPVLLAPGGMPDAIGSLRRAVEPDIVVRADMGEAAIEVLHAGDRSRHDLHPDLAMLSSTSGSTGSPKLVRLSSTNLASNAEAIATYLDLGGDDRACTSLPMHYCYGLSVVNSHLVRGASISLTDHSVIDPEFFESFVATGSTSFAGVPHTFDLLDRIGDGWMDLPGLRHVTQAGGRLAPEHVRRLALAGNDRGWGFFVMYGQTEATARMAYLPPDIAATHPGAIGRAVPGGSLDLAPVEGGSEIGELIYRGPNVMLGYAECAADLALGRTVDALHTGDLARRNEAGLFEIVGRCSRFVKIFGVRLDLDRIEQQLAEAGFAAACAGNDNRLVIACTDTRAANPIAALVSQRFRLPSGRITVQVVTELPRRPSGKVDYATILASANAARTATDGTDVRHVFASVFPGQEIHDDSTFVGLGGDSLTYVELCMRLEEALGHLPNDWPTMPLHQFEAGVGSASEQPARERASFIGGANRRHGANRQLETNVFLRALAIVAVVSSHAGLLTLRGGGHVLLVIAGYNFARFHLSATTRRLARSVVRIAVPTAAWMAVLLVTTDDYGLANLFFSNNQLGESFWDQRWRYWYVEALVQILLVVAAAFAVPVLRRTERRHPFGFAVAVFGGALAMRYLLDDIGGLSRSTHRPQTVVWLFALGWLAHAAGSDRRRQMTVAALAAACVPGFFVNDQRTVLVLAAVVLLVALPRMSLPVAAVRLASSLATSSLYIYLTHWQVYPALNDFPPLLGVAASLAAGVTLSSMVRRVRSRWANWAAAGATARVPVGSGLRVRSPRAA